MVTIICVVIIFAAGDTRTNFADPVGINGMNQANQLQSNGSYEYSFHNVTTHDDEWYVLPVVDVNLWWSKVTVYEYSNDNATINNIETFSLINGIQLIYNYKNDIINGDVFGRNQKTNNTLNDAVTVDIESFHGMLGDIGDIKVLNVYQDTNGLIHALQFNDDVLFGISNDTSLNQIQYEDYHFGGYQVSTSFVDIDFYDDDSNDVLRLNDMNIVSGFESIAFVDGDGQYGSTLSLQLSYFVIGLWFFIFSIPSFFYLKHRVRDPIPDGSAWWNVSIKSFWFAAKKAKKYPDLYRYLIVWFLFSDAMNTTANCSVLFGVVELGMTDSQLVLIMIEAELLAVIGAFFFVWFQKKVQWDSKQMHIMHLVFLGILPF